MKKLSKIIPREALWVIFFLSLLIFASSSIVAYMNMKDILQTEKDIANVYKNIDYLEKLVSTLADAEAGRRGYFITGDPEFLNSYKTASSTIDTLYSKLKKEFEESPEQQRYFDTLKILISQRFDLFKRSIDLQDSKGTNLKIHQPIMAESRELQSRIRILISRMKIEEEKTLGKKQEITNKSSTFTLDILAGGAAISSIILLIVFSMAMSSAVKTEKQSHKMTSDELETIVRQRTAEISRMNKKMNDKVAELERIDAELKHREQDYRALFEQAHDAIIIFDPQSEKILDVNVRACEIYGLNKEEFANVSLKRLFKNVHEAEQQIKITIEKGYYHNFQSVHYKKDGTEMLMEINASVIFYKGYTAILSINRDITDRIMRLS